LKCANRQEEGYLDTDSCRNFPQEELRIIDQLWLKYSQNRFGFSVQKQIWAGLIDELPELDSYDKLADKLGWRKGGKLLNRSELNFNTNAPNGHLPASVAYNLHFIPPSLINNAWGMTEYLNYHPKLLNFYLFLSVI
jgi:hypothetical protein